MFEGMFDTIDGLPVHVLVVHAVVVLIPLAAIGAIMMALRPRWVRVIGVATIAGAGVGAVAAFVSKISGESLASRVGVPNPHAEYGENYPLFVLAYLVLITVFWLYVRGVPLNRSRPLWLKGFGVVVILASIGIAYFSFITGHSGSEATWSSVIENTRPGTFQVEE